MRAAVVAPLLALAVHARPQDPPTSAGEADPLSTETCCDTTVITEATTTVTNTQTSTFVGGGEAFFTVTSVIVGSSTSVIAGRQCPPMHPAKPSLGFSPLLTRTCRVALANSLRPVAK